MELVKLAKARKVEVGIIVSNRLKVPVAHALLKALSYSRQCFELEICSFQASRSYRWSMTGC